MTPENKKRVSYSLAALAILLIWRPLREAVESDAVFFCLALAAILVAGAMANRLSR